MCLVISIFLSNAYEVIKKSYFANTTVFTTFRKLFELFCLQGGLLH